MIHKLITLLFILFTSLIFGQVKVKGNVIPEYGYTYAVPDPSFKTEKDSNFKVVFDIDRSFESTEPNKLIETAARFLNMHQNAGVPLENMEVALVLHGNAVKDVLSNEFYVKEYTEADHNPNIGLIEALSENGVEIILCGQSAAHHGVTKEKADKNVLFALSAMTALVQLQNENYRLINF